MAKENVKELIAAKTVVTPEFRLSYPHLFTKHSNKEGQEPQYSMKMMFPKKKTKLDRATPTSKGVSIESAIEAALEEAGLESFTKKMKNPLRDGDDEDENDEACKGHWFINATSKKNKPMVVDEENNEIKTDEEAEDVIYAGCYCRAQLRAYYFDKNGSKGVAFQVLMVKKSRDGEPLTGFREDPDDVFGSGSVDEDEAPKKKKKVVEEEEDETPKKKKKPVIEEPEEDEEEEDTPPPPKKKKKVVEEEEDEAPKKKKRRAESDF